MRRGVTERGMQKVTRLKRMEAYKAVGDRYVRSL
jgi:hypothetical protein